MRCSSRTALQASPDAESAAAGGQIHDAKVRLPMGRPLSILTDLRAGTLAAARHPATRIVVFIAICRVSLPVGIGVFGGVLPGRDVFT
jgi:hypothetical protein